MQDPYHCAIRFLAILDDVDELSIQWDLLRILDFFVVFPHQLARMRLPSQYRKKRKILNAISDPYENLPSSARLFFSLGEIQQPAARLLAATGLLDKDEFINGRIRRIESNLDVEINDICRNLSFRETAWYAFLIDDLSKLGLSGKDGLKHRAGLMEYRHDAA